MNSGSTRRHRQKPLELRIKKVCEYWADSESPKGPRFEGTCFDQTVRMPLMDRFGWTHWIAGFLLKL